MKKGVFITNLSDFLKADIERPFSILSTIEKYVLENEEQIQEKFDTENIFCSLQRVQFYQGKKYFYVEILNVN
jgi:hypothetical protein